MHRTATLALVFLCLAAFLTAPANVHAQSSGRYALSVENEPLPVVLADVKEKTGIDLIFEPALVEGKSASCTARNLRPPALLRCVLVGTGIRAERLRSGTFALRLDPSTGAVQSVSGFVRDAETGEALPGATVYAMDHGQGTTTNAYGYFRLSVPSDTVRVLVRFLGYTVLERDISTRQSDPVDLAMQRSAIELGGVEIAEDRERIPVTMTEPGALTLPVAQLEKTPPLLGEPDVLRGLQFAPGVQTGPEGSAGLFVRGGTRGQNLILLDGAPVYNAYHAFGFLSVFSPHAVRNVELRTGAFPARYGGRLASVVSLHLNEGNRHAYSGEASLGLVSAYATGEGPLPGEQGSFMVTARRSVAGDIAHWVAPDDVPFGRFYDISAKANVDLGDRDQLYVSVYRSRDAYDNDTREGSDTASGQRRRQANTFHMGWENTLATLRWSRAHGDDAFIQVMALVSDYRYLTRRDQYLTENEQVIDRTALATTSGLTDFGSRVDVDLLVSPRYRVRAGGSATLHQYDPGRRDLRVMADRETVLNTSVEPSGRTETLEWAGYAENQVEVTSRLFANAGMRISGSLVEGSPRVHLEPRLQTTLQLTDALQWTASYARMAQYVHQLSNSGVGLPTDLWVPATRDIGAQSSHQVSTGVSATLGRTVARVEGYRKWMDGLLEYRPGASYVSGRDWRTLVTEGRGHAQGIEVSVQKPAGRLTGQFSYTLSKSTRTFDALNGGDPFPFRYDHRHHMAVTASYALTKTWTGTVAWMYRSGSAITMPSQRSSVESEWFLYSEHQLPLGAVWEYGERNGYRMPASHRLDLSILRTIPTSWGHHEIQAGVYNAYNQKNPFFLFLDTRRDVDNPGPNQEVEFQTYGRVISLLPTVPSLRYTVSF